MRLANIGKAGKELLRPVYQTRLIRLAKVWPPEAEAYRMVTRQRNYRWIVSTRKDQKLSRSEKFPEIATQTQTPAKEHNHML